MSRAVNLKMEESEAIARCQAENVGVSAIEKLPAGGVRLVCMSSEGALLLRRKLKSQVITGEVQRGRHRPAKPLW